MHLLLTRVESDTSSLAGDDDTLAPARFVSRARGCKYLNFP